VCAGHWRGSKKGDGHVGGRRGRETRRRARVRTRRSTMTRGEGGADRAGPRRRERGQGRAGNSSMTGNPGPRDRERKRARGRRKTGADRLVPLNRERERVGARGCADRWGSPVRQRGRAGAHAGWLIGLPWAEIAFPISLDFLIPFLFLFL
jgi:hypothetical protein